MLHSQNRDAAHAKRARAMTDTSQPLLIKRYASRRLYNTATSDYVTLEDIAGFIRDGREVQIIDLKSGDDLTRQYLLQIVADHESRGESVLPISVLTDLVRSYTTQAHSVVPEFLASSFEMLKQGQSKMLDNMAAISPMASMPGFDAMRAQQEAFFKAMTAAVPTPNTTPDDGDDATPSEELKAIKRQLAELQSKLNKM